MAGKASSANSGSANLPARKSEDSFESWLDNAYKYWIYYPGHPGLIDKRPREPGEHETLPPQQPLPEE
jgi:hypothetical protein